MTYPLARPTTSFFSSQCWPCLYRPLSSTALLSPLVRNFMSPFSLLTEQQHFQPKGKWEWNITHTTWTTWNPTFRGFWALCVLLGSLCLLSWRQRSLRLEWDPLPCSSETVGLLCGRLAPCSRWNTCQTKMNNWNDAKKWFNKALISKNVKPHWKTLKMLSPMNKL